MALAQLFYLREAIRRRARSLRHRWGRRHVPHRRSFTLESLEGRILLSAAPLYTAAEAPQAVDLTLTVEVQNGVDTLLVVDNSTQAVLASVDFSSLSQNEPITIIGSAYDDRVTIDASVFNANITQGIQLDGGGGEDTLLGPSQDLTWHIGAPDAGSVGSVFFTNIANLTGAADNQDTFVFEAGGSISGTIDGGVGGFDSLILNGGTFDTGIFSFTNNSDGTIDLTGNSLINYIGLEPLTMTGTITNLILTFTGGSEAITLIDAAGANMRISSTLSESLTFANPTGSLTINAGTGNDTVTITSVDAAFNATLTINGNQGSDVINLNADITFAAGKNLDVNLTDDDAVPAADTINVGSNANLILAGAGTATLQASGIIQLASGSSVTTVDGGILLSANQQATPTVGNFVGVTVNSGALVAATGSGTVTVRGSGGASSSNNNYGVLVGGVSAQITANGGAVLVEGTGGGTAASSGNIGVYVVSGGVITNAGTGTVTVRGTGGNRSGTSGDINYGVVVNLAGSQITAGGGAVTVEGTGGGAGTSTNNYGVYVVSGGVITNAGAGTVTVTGIGGNTSGTFNYGVRVSGASAQITANGGAVLVTGTGGAGTNSFNYGTVVDTGGVITNAGTGVGATVTVRGTGGASSGNNNYGVLVVGTNAQITANGGAVWVEGTGGGAGTSSGNYGVYVLSGGVITNAGTGAGATVTVTGTGGNSSGTGSSNYGVYVSGTNAQITANGGAVLVTGTGGGVGTSGANLGVYVESGGVITNAGTGAGATVTVRGTGGNSTGGSGSNYGVFVAGAGAQITASGGAVQVTGTGGGAGTSGANFGVVVQSGGVITNAGTGAGATVTVTGTGGNTSGSNSTGVFLVGTNTQITASGGAVQVTGTGGGTGTSGSNLGVFVSSGAVITNAGTGTGATVTVTGTGGNSTGSGNANFGVYVTGTGAQITASGGAISILGVSGSGTSSSAILISSGGQIVSTIGAPTVTLIGDSMDLQSLTSINAGANTVVLKPRTAGTFINLGGPDVLSGSPLTLGLTDAELDSVTAGTINIGDGTSSTITFSADITRAANTNVNLTTGSGDDIAFGTFALNAGAGGDVSLTTSGSGAITTGDNSGTDLTADDVTMTAGAGGIGSTTNFLRLAAATVTGTTSGNGAINLVEADSVTIAAPTGLDAGTGTITLGGGTFLVTGSTAAGSPVTVQSTATLGGTGTVGGTVTVQSGGTVAPGTSPGILNSGSVTFVSGSTFNVEVNGTVAGTSYDQLNVTGTVNLGNATLNATGTIPSATGQTIVLINNDGTDAVGGTFAGLPQGSVVTINGIDFTISYTGGSDNNDVVLLSNIAVNLSVSAMAGTEAGTTAITVTATAGGAVSGNQTIDLGVSGTNITVGDYTLSNGTITILNGQTVGSVTFTVKDDLLNEGDETATLTISNPSAGLTLGTTTTQDITITDDDNAGTSHYGLPEAGAYRVVRNGSTIEIYDTGNSLIANRPMGTDPLVINGTSGDDTLTIDFTGGNFMVPISFNGGAQTSTPGDSLILTGGTFATGTFAFTNNSDGSIDLTGNSLISYTGLEPMLTTGTTINDVILTFNGGAETITLTDATGAAMTIDSTLGESLTFANPTDSLTINAGTGDDTVTITSVDTAYNAALTINGDQGHDTINLNADITFAAGKNLDVNLTDDAAVGDADTINVGSNANLTLAGAGTATLQASRSIALASGSSVTTVNGGITLSANQQATSTAGNFVGVTIDSGALVAATGSGAVTVNGRGGDAGGGNDGVFLINGAQITASGGAVLVEGTGGGAGAIGVFVLGASVITNGGSGGGATVTVRGSGSTGSGFGVFLGAAGAITASGGAVTVEGTGGAGHDGVGVYVALGGVITNGGSGVGATVTVRGTGGTGGTGGANFGVFVTGTNSQITANGGAVLVEGTGGGAGTNIANYGVLVQSGGVITNAGTGAGATVTVRGTGGNTSGTGGGDNIGVFVSGAGTLSQITSSGGGVLVEGTGGGAGTSTGNYGVYLNTGGVITNAGTGAAATVTVTGIGGTGAGGTSNHGVVVRFTGAQIASSGGAILITGVRGSGTSSSAIFISGNGQIVGTTGASPVTLIGDSMDFQSTTSINAGVNTVVLKPRTAGTLINLGGADVLSGSPLTLGLTDAELDRIIAGTVQVGDTNSGTITFSAAIALLNSNTLEIVTGGDITQGFAGTALSGDALLLKGDLAPGLAGTGSFSVDGPVTFDATASYEVNLNGIASYDQLVVAGNSRVTTLGGADLVITLDTVPAVGSQQVFRIVDSTGTGSVVSGTFKVGGVTRNDGDTFTVGSTIFRINYNPAGAAGDVVLTEAGAVPVNLSVSVAAGAEAGTTAITVTATADAAVSGDQTVDLGVSGTNVTAGDYTLSNNTITILSGQTVGSVTFTVADDTLLEGTETATLTISNPSAGLTLGTTTTQNVVISDNESATLAIAATSTATEAGGAQTVGVVTLTITGTGSGTYALGTGISVTADVTDAGSGTASSGADYSAFGTQTVTFNGGAVSGATRSTTLTTTDDHLLEGSETVNLSLSNLGGAAVAASLGNTAHVTTLSDNESATLAIAATSSASEAGGAQTVGVVTLTITGTGSGTYALGTGISVTADVTDAGSGTASSGADYSAFGTQTVTFNGGAVSGATRSTTLTTTDDHLLEGSETVNLSLSNLGGSGVAAALGNTAHVTTLSDNESATLAIAASSSASEAGGAQTVGVVTLTITGTGSGTYALGTGISVTADVTDAGSGTASSGADYSAFGTQAVTFGTGAISGATRSTTLTTTDDHLLEGSETVNLSLSNLGGSGVAAALGNTAHITTLSDNESATLAIAATSTATEAGGAQTVGVVTLTITGTGSGTYALGTGISVTADVTDAGSGTASSGADYSAFGTQTVTFNGGAVSGATRSTTLITTDDHLLEGSETITLALGNLGGSGVGAALGNTAHITTLSDNESATLAIAATSSASEAGGAQTVGVVTLTITGTGSGTYALGTGISVTADVTDAGSGTASSGADYSAFGTQTVTFNGGAVSGATRSTTLITTDDHLLEGSETVNLSLSNLGGSGVAAALGNTAHITTLSDNESATLAIAATSSASEAGGAQTVGVVTLTITGTGSGTYALGTGISVTADVTDAGSGTASSGADCSAVGTQTVTFNGGAVSGATRSTTLTTTDDHLLEGSETITLALGNLGGSGVGAALGATANITTLSDNESATLAIAASSSASEAGGAQTVGVVTLTITGTGSGTYALGTGISVTADVTDAGSGTASSGADYSAFGTQTVTFNGGAVSGATRNTTLTVTDDHLLEGSETITLALGNLGGSGVGAALGATANVTMLSDNESATLAIAASSSASEAGGAQTVGVVTLTITGTGSGTYALGTGISVTADVTDAGSGTASSGADYSAFGTQTVTFNGGAVSGATRSTTLTTTDDHLLEGSETVNLSLSNLGGSGVAAALGNTAHITTLSDNESATLAIAASSSASEAGGAQTVGVVTLTITGTGSGTYALGTGISVTADVTDAGSGTASSGADYSAVGTQTVTFNLGASTGAVKYVTLTTINDTLVEGNETVNLKLQNLGKPATVAASFGTINNTTTITDNDTATLAIEATKTVTEQGGAQTITVTMTTTDGGAGTATLAPGVTLTADVVDLLTGTASSGILNDYTAFGTQTVSFGPGTGNAATRTVTLTPTNDATAEVPNETVNLKLQNLNTTLNGQASLGNVASTVTISDNDTTSTLTVSTPKQYSDLVTFTATLSPAIVQGQAPATTVTFWIGTQNMGTANLVASGSILTGTLTVPLLETVAGQMAPGVRTVTAVFGGINPNATVNSPTPATLTITREDADITYSGQSFVNTASPTSTTALVPLEAVIRDITVVNALSDPNAGAILKATVTFKIYDAFSGSLLATITPTTFGLIGSDTRVALAQASYSANLGNANAGIYRVETIVNGYYTDVEETLVTVAKPVDYTINAGGYVVASSSDGSYKADAGSKINFGINIGYNKSMTNVQGKVNEIFRHTEGGVVHTYQIKSNASGALSVDATTGVATFTAKATLIDITNAASPITIGNFDMVLRVDDNGEPGTGSNNKGNDKYSLRLMNGTTLIFASSWDGTQTQLQTLDGGNIQVRPYSETLISFATGTGGDQTITEGDSGSQSLVFTVKLSQASTQTVKVNYSTANNSATAGGAVPDYVPTNGTLTFAPGVTTQTITVMVKGDTLDEPDETFFVNLSNPIQAGIQDASAIGVILDNDPSSPLQALGGATTGGVDAEALTSDAVQPLLAAAIEQWRAAGADPQWLNSLDTIQVKITDLPGSTLGLASQGLIVLDRDAAGYGWFVDSTPRDNAEFHVVPGLGAGIAVAYSQAVGRIDLLSAIVHEMGHELGFGHESGLTVMQDSLETGVRRWAGDNSFQVEGGVVAAASDDSQAITKPHQTVATGADFSRILGSVGTGNLIDWTEKIPGNGHTVDPSFTPNSRLSWVKGFLSDLGTHTDQYDADEELEVTLPGPRT